MFACRVCDECVATRKNDWVARAMAERATSTEAFLITLTYRNNPDGSQPDGARAFRYQHVQTFLKRLREEYARQYQARGEIRYIVAGERGEKRDRVHWHMVIFADRPISTLGKWVDYFKRALLGPRVGKKKALDFWSMWDHGQVDVHEPTQAGMAYVLKYALKDQFNEVKSRRTGRFTQSEQHAASYFRMSKKPPIGFRFLEKRLDEFETERIVPVKAQLRVPGYSGYWWPKGKLREYFLDRLHLINEQRIEETGRPCPQWTSLLASVEQMNKDWERLVYGPDEKTEGGGEEDFDNWAEELRIGSERAAIRSRCGGARVCRLCFRGQPQEAGADFRSWYAAQVREYVTSGDPRPISFENWYREKREINPFCILRDEDGRKDAFAA